MITLRLSVASLVLFVVGGSLLVNAGIVGFMVLGKVNGRLPEDEQFGYFLIYPSKAAGIAKTYRRLYPKGRLEILRKLLVAAGAASLVAAGLGIGRR